MSSIAIISQTMRASHCRAFIVGGGSPWTILTSDPSAFDGYEFSESVRIVAVSPPPELVPSAQLTRSRIFRSILSWARSGSRLGRWLERTTKRLAWHLRYFDRIVMLRRSRTTREMDDSALPSTALYMRLEVEHAATPIDRIVVFDVFDLPVALAFGRAHGLKVLVR